VVGQPSSGDAFCGKGNRSNAQAISLEPQVVMNVEIRRFEGRCWLSSETWLIHALNTDGERMFAPASMLKH
jgi:hypothetical protein